MNTLTKAAVTKFSAQVLDLLHYRGSAIFETVKGKMMQTQTMRVWFHDEGWPQIGCGVRFVRVQKGWKWVFAREANGQRKRFLLSDWMKIERGSKNV